MSPMSSDQRGHSAETPSDIPKVGLVEHFEASLCFAHLEKCFHSRCRCSFFRDVVDFSGSCCIDSYLWARRRPGNGPTPDRRNSGDHSKRSTKLDRELPEIHRKLQFVQIGYRLARKYVNSDMGSTGGNCQPYGCT